MTLSNFYTSLRLVLVPFFLLTYFLPEWVQADKLVVTIVLCILYGVISITDYLDGYYARKLNQTSNFGKLYDPFADVIANVTVFLCFVRAGYMMPLFFVIILWREFSILFLRAVAAGQGITIGAKSGGKLKTVVYITGCSISLVIELLRALHRIQPEALQTAIFVNQTVYFLGVVLSVSSFIDYLVSFKKSKPAV